jgi:hypothetical protein
MLILDQGGLGEEGFDVNERRRNLWRREISRRYLAGVLKSGHIRPGR